MNITQNLKFKILHNTLPKALLNENICLCFENSCNVTCFVVRDTCISQVTYKRIHLSKMVCVYYKILDT